MSIIHFIAGWLAAAIMGTAATAAPISAAPTLAGPAAWDPDHIAWQRTNPDGTRFALLEGRRDTPGAAFSYAFFIPAGTWDGPHRHSATARVFVARGTLRLGYAGRSDKAAARRFPAGSYLLVPAGAVHFDGALEETIIIGTAMGPWTTEYVDKAAAASAGTLR